MRGFITAGPSGLGTSAARVSERLKPRPAPAGQAAASPSRPDGTTGRAPTSPASLGTSAARPPGGRSSSAVCIPRLYCPEPVRIDEALGAEVNDRLVAWVRQIGIFAGQLDHVRACNYGRYAMLIHPDTDDPGRLLLAAQCMAALFAVDDHYCDDERTGSDAALLGRRLAIAQAALDPVYILDEDYAARLGEALRADPVLAGLGAYMDRVVSFATPAQADRVRQVTAAMFIPMNWEAGWRVAGGLPAAWEYLTTRQPNSFAPCMTLIDIIGGYEVPGALYSLPAVRRATMLAANASIILNDLYSMAKEHEPGIGDGGLPDIIAAERGCSLQEAADRTAVIHDDLVRAFEAAQRRLMVTVPSPQLWRYLAGLHAWLGGSHEWHRSSGRYSTGSK